MGTTEGILTENRRDDMLHEMRSRLEDSRSFPLLSDSATGTWFQQHAPELGGECCDRMNGDRPDLVARMYRLKIEAGADLVLTNTFNCSPVRLQEFGLRARCSELNRVGVALLREAAQGAGRPVFAGGNMGPTGKVIGVTATYDEITHSYREQAQELLGAGVDAICIETILQPLEAQAALEAVHEAGAGDTVVYATFSFLEGRATQGGYRTFFGETIPELMEGKYDKLAKRPFVGLRNLPVDVIGSNCTVGLDDVIGIIGEFREYLVAHGLTDRFRLAAKPNSVIALRQHYEPPELAETRFAALHQAGADIIGFCCGSVPDHIRAAARARENGIRGTAG